MLGGLVQNCGGARRTQRTQRMSDAFSRRLMSFLDVALSEPCLIRAISAIRVNPIFR